MMIIVLVLKWFSSGVVCDGFYGLLFAFLELRNCQWFWMQFNDISGPFQDGGHVDVWSARLRHMLYLYYMADGN